MKKTGRRSWPKKGWEKSEGVYFKNSIRLQCVGLKTNDKSNELAKKYEEE
ncbi:hypothetical protein [Peribacillus simplex]